MIIARITAVGSPLFLFCNRYADFALFTATFEIKSFVIKRAVVDMISFRLPSAKTEDTINVVLPIFRIVSDFVISVFLVLLIATSSLFWILW
jgi:hypothetical protein